ncbi:DUF3564 family protein [Paraburkholderia oxyphila]|uniref:DUF3564 family protein n=1 Tax=Paraburkholderia oxyphila TaxID=614212 RepID=UPI0005B945E9|nr:DUF3564 family protein [Paraburkholderia oxyphila]
MRLTILINGPDPTVNHDYAVLWLDTDEQRWSREAHAGINLPQWGEIQSCVCTTLLSGPGSTEPLCVLHDLYLTRREEVSRADGIATLTHDAQPGQTDWHWHLQAVDRTRIHADSALFAGETSAHPSVSARTSPPTTALTAVRRHASPAFPRR